MWWNFKKPLARLFDVFELLEISDSFTYFPADIETVDLFLNLSHVPTRWGMLSRHEDVVNWMNYHSKKGW